MLLTLVTLGKRCYESALVSTTAVMLGCSDIQRTQSMLTSKQNIVAYANISCSAQCASILYYRPLAYPEGILGFKHPLNLQIFLHCVIIYSFITIYKAHYMSAMSNQRRWRQSLGGQLSAK